ncbi:MAG TPA: PHB depolymerase family esterase [Rhizobacter sp.]|jgi:polyhydroxybutyrate depolymerase|nr:PHB depolymerase family esterase [Rhizobacter sp.]
MTNITLSLALAVAAAGMGSAQAAPVCNTSTQAAGNSSYTITHGGTSRSYRLHIPANLVTPAAVVLSLHGLSSSSSSQQNGSGWDAVSNSARNVVVAYPDGVNAQWNVAGFNPNVDDTGFMKAIVDHISQRVRIAPNRVYISGTSLGGGFSHKMACTQADYFAAAAPVVFHLHSSPQDYVCAPQRPITVLEYAGLNDLLVRYSGGTSSVQGHTVTHLSANASFQKWASLSGCTGNAVTTWSRLTANNKQYQNCAGGVIVGLASLSCGHGYCADTSFGPPPADAWKVFKNQVTPGLKADACGA